MAQGQGSFSFIDYDREPSSMTFWTGVITAGNLPGVLTQFGNLRTAIDGISLCTISRESLKVFETNLSRTKPTNKLAQREEKWLVVYADNTAYFDAPTNSIPNEGFGKIFSVEIPGADLSQLVTDSNLLNVGTGTPGETFVNAFQTLAKSPHGGTPLVLEIRHVGRNT